MYRIGTILLFLSYFSQTSGLSCVQCSATREKQLQGQFPCSEFDWSSKYIVECPKSTFCFKRTYEVPFGKEHVVHSIEKGCAQQLLNSHNYNQAARKWDPTEEIVDSIYQEGCSKAEDNGRPGAQTEYCYCSSWLCNGSSSFTNISFHVISIYFAAILFLI